MEKKTHYLIDQEAIINHENPSHIIGIGASAGGLEALELFFDAVPDQNTLSFVVILHLSPDYKSLMPQLLAKHTKMKVHTIESGMEVLAGNVYVIPPKKTLTVHKGILYLHDKVNTKMPTFPIDIFLRSLADEQGEKAIGIILSGTGSDGMRGVRAIKETSGVVMVQSPESAKFDGMPNVAISTGLVDYVLPPQKMPLELINYIEHPHIVLDKHELSSANGDAYVKVHRIIKQVTGIDFSQYKKETILRRIKRKMNITKITELDEYVLYLENNPEEIIALQKDLLIGVTKFFRDIKAFEYLGNKVIPEICDRGDKDQGIKVWVAGCSTGEEVYTVAILINEYLNKVSLNMPVKIFATDIDKEAVAKASIGNYSESAVTDIPKTYLDKYFIHQGETHQINRTIREMIIFTTHDISRDPPFHRLDMIVCRNMLIYFQNILQKKVFKIFSFALKQNGYLFLGSSESADDLKNLFVPVHAKWKVYRSIFQTSLINIQTYDRPDINSANKVNTPFRSIENAARIKDTQQINIVNDLLVEEFGTGCILITEGMDFIRYYGNASQYVSVPKKLKSWSILDMVDDKLSIAISTAVRKALQENKPIRYNDVVVKSKTGEPEVLNLVVKPHQIKNTTERLVLVILDKNINQDKADNENMSLGSNTALRIQDLEHELKITRETLQATIEELQTSNEELIASNEELQSTNEELQSVNEELHTINSEHQASIIELTELNDDINNLLQSTEIGTLFLGKNLHIRKFNNSIAENISITERDLGRPIEHFANNLDYPGFIEDIRSVLKTLITVEKEIQSKDRKWYLVRILPYRTYENQIKGVVITMVDINNLREAKQLKKLTEKLTIEVKEHKKTLCEKEELNTFLTELYSVMPSIIYIYDLKERKNVFASRSIAKVIGWTSEEIQKMEGNMLSKIIPKYEIEKIIKHHKVLASVEGNETKIIEYQVSSRDGSIHWIRSIDKAYKRDASGTVTQIIGVAYDVTSEMEAQIRIQESNTQLQNQIEEANSAKNELNQKNRQLSTINTALESFAYSTSHDLKEPIRSICSFAQLIQQGYSKLLDDTGNQYLDIILDKSTRLYQTIESILAYSKLGNENIKTENVNTKNTIEKVISDLDSSVKQSGAQLIISELPVIKTDEMLFYKIVQNLISNSLKFSRKEVLLKIEINHYEEKEKHTFAIKDNGIGFDPQYQEMIFEMLKQLKTERQKDGSGIGLALCKRLVENLGGEIWAESKKGGGSTFYFSLPKSK